jgi:hypothetical protein
MNVQIRRLCTMVSGAVVLLAASQAAGEAPSGTVYRVRATVPVACWVRSNGTILAGNGLRGSVIEACNSPGGFTVSAAYRPLTEAESTKMFYGGNKLDLSKSGTQVLARSAKATVRTVEYSFEDVTLNAPLALFLTIQPI